jgi:hypothetical protein
MKRYRILKNDLGQFKVQRKGWFFWHDCGRDFYDITITIYFDTHHEARTDVDRRMKADLDDIYRSLWKVVWP